MKTNYFILIWLVCGLIYWLKWSDNIKQERGVLGFFKAIVLGPIGLLFY
jgi:hypothetical protein